MLQYLYNFPERRARVSKKFKLALFSNNTLKIIAAAAMVCDHVGAFLFPELTFLRMIGRIAFPIFAFLIAEGAKHTKNKLRHIVFFASFAAVVQAGYFIFNPSVEMSVLVTFTLSLLMIYALDGLKAAFFAVKPSKRKIASAAALFLGSLGLAVTFDHFLDLDYGLSGALLPLFPAIFTAPQSDGTPAILKKADTKLVRVSATAIGTLVLCLGFGGIQFYSLLSIPLLLLYSEKRGSLNMKYFLYVFYPLHLVIIYGIGILIKYFS